MQLIDYLEARYDSVKLMENVDDVSVSYDMEDKVWFIEVDGGEYGITKDAFDNLLNMLKIPIKYAWRFAEQDERSKVLAEGMINYWLGQVGALGFLIEGLMVTQVFSGSSLYIPGVKINDLIFEYLNGEVEVHSFVFDADVFNAVYLSDKHLEIGGYDYKVGIRVLYSDCFSITPRFDGVLYCEGTGAVLAWPTIKRKFRVAENTIPQVFAQVEEFIDVSVDGMMSDLVHGLKEVVPEQIVVADSLTFRLCMELRLSRKIGLEILEVVGYRDMELLDYVHQVAAYTVNLKKDTVIDINVAREIQVALSKYLVDGVFK